MGACEHRIWGVDVDYASTWGGLTKPSTVTKTTANIDYNFYDSFSPNASYDTIITDLNAIAFEIMQRSGWKQGNPISIAIKRLYTGLGKWASIYPFENAFPSPQLIISHEGTPPPTETPCTPFATHQWHLQQECYYADQNNQNIGNNELSIDFNGFIGDNNTTISSNQITIKWRWREFTTKEADLNALDTYAGYSVAYMIWNYPDIRHSGNVWRGQYPLTSSAQWAEINFQDGNEYYVGHTSFGLCTGYGFATDLNIMYYNSSTGWNTAFQDASFDETKCDWNGYYLGIGCSFWCDVNANINAYTQKIRFSWSKAGMIKGQQGDYNWLGISEIIAVGKDNHWNKMHAITTTNKGQFIIIN